MQRALFAFCILTFTFIMGCTTRYQLVQKYINKGQSYYDRGNYTKSLKEFSKALTNSGTNPSDYEITYLLAVLYHRLYLMNITSRWADLNLATRSRFDILSKIIDEASVQKTDFLQQAFAIILRLEQKAGTPDAAKLEPWVVVEKEMIIGDILYRAGQENRNPLPQIKLLNGDEPFIDKIRLYTLYELARHFYLSAWLRTKETEPSIIPEYLRDVAQLRLKEVYWSLATLSSVLSYQERDREFTDKFKSKTHDYWEALKVIESASGGKLLAAASYDQINQSLDRDLFVLDQLFQLNTGRDKLTLAVESTLAGKFSKAQDSFLAALNHFTLTQQLRTDSAGNEKTDLLNIALNDIYLNLHRLSIPR